jgi:ribonuclease P protein subunit RPR2
MKGKHDRTVLERIDALFSRAEKLAESSPANARRCVELAIKNAMRYNVTIPKKYRMSYCRKCYAYLKPGLTSTHRTSPKQEALIVTCRECRSVMRFPYRKEKSAAKAAKKQEPHKSKIPKKAARKTRPKGKPRK